MGIVAHSNDGGNTWTTRQPFDFEYNDLPEASQTYSGRKVNFVIWPINEDSAAVGLSYGSRGWTINSGFDWDETGSLTQEQWFYGVNSWAYMKWLFGSSGSIYHYVNFPLSPTLDYYSKKYDLLGCSTNREFLHFAVGTNVIVKHSNIIAIVALIGYLGSHPVRASFVKGVFGGEML